MINLQPSPLPGFHIAWGATLLWVSLIVLLPLMALVFHISDVGMEGFMSIAQDPRVKAALWLSFSLSFAATCLNLFLGGLLAFVLTRYDFWGRRFLDAMVDLPFALPTAVAGIALATLYGPHGWLGAPLARLGIQVAFTPSGIFVALVFIGLPFVVRTLQPVLEDLIPEIEEASASLGASRLQTFCHILLPILTPALLTGFSLAFARSVGEYGSVIFMTGNIPYVSEIAPLLIVVKLDSFDENSATVIASLMLGISFLVLLLINGIQGWRRWRMGV